MSFGLRATVGAEALDGCGVLARAPLRVSEIEVVIGVGAIAFEGFLETGRLHPRFCFGGPGRRRDC